MFGSGKRERERGRRAAAEAFPFLEEVLDHELAVRAGTTAPDPTRYAIVPIVKRLLPICRNDPVMVTTLIQTWWERYEAQSHDDEDEESEVVRRGTAASAVFLSVGLNGIGNLFGLIPSDAPSFDANLAGEGRARRWRR